MHQDLIFCLLLLLCLRPRCYCSVWPSKSAFRAGTNDRLYAQVLWTGEAAVGGFLAVVDSAHEGVKYRLLKADHSVLGGVYRESREFAGQSIYAIFYLQEAVRCLPCAARILAGRT